MTWLVSALSSAWAKIAAAAAIVGAVLLFVAKVFQAGRTAARAESAESALKHQTDTSKQVQASDEALADPRSTRAERVRERFTRPD